MYLSRLTLNPRSRRVQREMVEPYQMHRTLMRSFPSGMDRQEERVLFRVDADTRAGKLALLVQSTLRPEWGWLGGDGARGYVLEPPETKRLDLPLAPGQVLAFRLLGNPTVKRRFADGAHKRVGLYRADEQEQWLKRKGEQGGFRVLSVRVSEQGSIVGPIDRDGVRHNLRLLTVRFDGILQVVDPGQLAQTVRRGVGSGKGLGCGLLSLGPARSP